MLITILTLFLYAAVAAIVIYGCLWLFTLITGISLPARIVQLIWVVFALLVLIWFLQAAPLSLPRLR